MQGEGNQGAFIGIQLSGCPCHLHSPQSPCRSLPVRLQVWKPWKIPLQQSAGTPRVKPVAAQEEERRAWTEDGHRSSRTCLEQLASCLRSFPSISPKVRYLSVLGERLGSEVRHGLGKTCRTANPLRQGEESNDSLPLPPFLHFSPYSVLYVKRGCYFPCIFYIM